MAISGCNTTVNREKRELVQHGTAAFPVACYQDDLRRDEVPWHWHEELEAGVIAKGQIRLAAGGQSRVIGAGQGFFVNSQVLHGCWEEAPSDGVIHSLVFHPRLVGGSIDSVFFQSYVQPLAENAALEAVIFTPETPWHRAALEQISRAWDACAREPAGYEFRVRDALSELVLLLQSNAPAAQRQPGAKALRDGGRIKQMLEYVHAHFAEDLDTACIARAAAISESECLRCFRATIGTTPIQYVRQYRVQAAARRLAAGDEKIALVAAGCGFSDVSYFTKTFREMKGCTPAEYRKRAVQAAKEPEAERNSEKQMQFE